MDARKYKHYLVDACGDLFHFSYTTYNNFIDFMEAFLYNFFMVLFEESEVESNSGNSKQSTGTLFPNGAKQAGKPGVVLNKQLRKTHIKLDALVLFAEQLASMLKAG